MSDVTREFIHLKRAWYADSALKGMDYDDEVLVSIYDGDDTLGEVMMRWYFLGGYTGDAPRIEAFNDSFRALSSMSDVLDKLISLGKRNFTPEEYSDILKVHGYTDVTPLTQ